MDDKKRRRSLGELGRTPLGLLLILGAVAGLAVAVLIPMLSNGSGHGTNTAFADVNPAGCDPTIGSGAGFLQGSPGAIPVTIGTHITYTVGVSYPAPLVGVGCTAFDIHVGLETPDGVWHDQCTIATLVSGAPTTLCPTTFDYTVLGTESLPLTGHLNAKGDKHDRLTDCIDPNLTDFTTFGVCWGAQQTSILDFATPTSTPTDTATASPTSTQTPFTPVVRTATPTNTPMRSTPSVTPTKTPVIGVLPLVATPRAAVVPRLPNTGTGEGAVNREPLVAAAALLAVVAAAAFVTCFGTCLRRSHER
jgi:hypothetical protein